MESEFIAIDKVGEEADQQLEEHRVIITTVSHVIYDVDTIPLGNCSQMELSQLTM
jgi:hypothetical protein